MMNRTHKVLLCSIAGCTHEAEEAGMCNMHFTSALVHGALQYSARPVHS
ncbi:hypothetical protein BLI708_03005 [Bifidobacterium imperatoris]|uniref:Uncharacterized protein n=1 Tax=Bifidobacterium imperatoris TaxID=2020965 RepID=A0ABX7S7K2_9BIFI|nr:MULTISPECIES: hypothetical protein [Bifidobacterium]QSY58911.1 hypothetical protein BLI708_03005 [Bifidobacterium imperatoris]